MDLLERATELGASYSEFYYFFYSAFLGSMFFLRAFVIILTSEIGSTILTLKLSSIMELKIEWQSNQAWSLGITLGR